MKKTFFLFLISLVVTRVAKAQSTNDLFERIDPYQQQPATNPQQAPAYGYPSQQPLAPAYPQAPTQPQQVYQPPQYVYPPQQPAAPTYPAYPQAPTQPQQLYQPPAPANPDAVKVFGNGFDFKNSYTGQAQQPGSDDQPMWQDPGTINPEKEEKNYETRLKEGLEKPIPKRNITIGDDRIDELRSRVNALKVPNKKTE